MSLDWENTMKDLRLRIKGKQEELRKLTDDELMQLHDAILDSVVSTLHKKREKRPDTAMYGAIISEVDKRAKAACWFWKRWRKPNGCRKWLEHKKHAEENAQRLVHEKFSEES